ncbi:MAG: polysaccharide deacetylase, partial [Victivallales bacterium]|nr:polysaccharide deacetylase [Victivallales bacterium]
DLTLDEDFPGTETVTVTPAAVPADEAGQTVTYTISPTTVAFATVAIDEDTGTVSIDAVADADGTQLFTITANDAQAAHNTATATFTLTVGTVDDAPTVANALADVVVDEDAADTVVDLADVFTDVDNDDTAIAKAVLTNTDTDLVVATIVDDELTLDYQPDANGSATITIQATSNGKTVDEVFVVTVTPVNDAPAFAT